MVCFSSLMITTPSGKTAPFDFNNKNTLPLLQALKGHWHSGAEHITIDHQAFRCASNLASKTAIITTETDKLFVFTWASATENGSNNTQSSPLGAEGDDCFYYKDEGGYRPW